MALEGYCAFPTYLAGGEINPVLVELESSKVVKAKSFGYSWCTFCFNREDAVMEAYESWSRGQEKCDEWHIVKVTLTGDQLGTMVKEWSIERKKTKSGYHCWFHYGDLPLDGISHSFTKAKTSVENVNTEQLFVTFQTQIEG